MRFPALTVAAVASALLLSTGSVIGQAGSDIDVDPLVDPPVSDAAVVRGVLFFSPTCPHCELVISEHLPPIFETWGGGFAVSYDETLPAGQVAYYLMGNDILQLLMVDTSVKEGVEIFVEDSSRLGLERAGVPRIDVADDYLVGSTDIPTLLPGIIADGLAAGGIDWPPVPGIDEALRSFDTAGPLDGSTRPSTDDPAGGPAQVLPAAAGRGPLDRFGDDPLANGIAVVVLVALLASLVAVPVLAVRGRLRSFADWLVPVLAVLGLVVAGYLASVETSGGEAVCGPVGDCNAVQQSEYASLVGIPIGVIGVLGYLAIGGFWLLTRLGHGRLADRAHVSVALGAFVGVLFSTYLTFLEPFVIGATCLWCISSALLMLALLWVTAGAGWAAWGRLRGTGPRGGQPASASAAASR